MATPLQECRTPDTSMEGATMPALACVTLTNRHGEPALDRLLAVASLGRALVRGHDRASLSSLPCSSRLQPPILRPVWQAAPCPVQRVPGAVGAGGGVLHQLWPGGVACPGLRGRGPRGTPPDHRGLRGHGRLHRYRRAAGPRGPAPVADGLLLHRQRGHPPVRRDSGEVHRRCGHGPVRCTGGERTRRVPGRPCGPGVTTRTRRPAAGGTLPHADPGRYRHR